MSYWNLWVFHVSLLEIHLFVPGQQFFAWTAGLPLVQQDSNASRSEPIAVLHQPPGRCQSGAFNWRANWIHNLKYDACRFRPEQADWFWSGFPIGPSFLVHCDASCFKNQFPGWVRQIRPRLRGTQRFGGEQEAWLGGELEVYNLRNLEGWST